MRKYTNFDVQLDLTQLQRGRGRLRVVANYAPIGEAVGERDVDYTTFTPLTLRTRAHIEWRDESIASTGASVLTQGAELGRMLLPGKVGELFSEARRDCLIGERPSPDKGLRLRLRCYAQELSALPWEFVSFQLRTGRTMKEFLVHQPELSLVRVETEVKVPNSELIEVGPEVIVVSVDASRVTAEKLDSDLPPLPAKTRKLGRTFIHKVVNPPTVRTLEATFETLGHVDIFHFCGHGKRPTSDRPSSLKVGSEDRRSQTLPGADLATLLAGCDCRLAVLSACETANRGNEAALQSVAEAIIRAGVPAVVAMQQRIDTRHASAFMDAFYKSLFKGHPIDTAVYAGRKELMKTQHQQLPSWGIPVLHLQSSKGEFLGPLPSRDRGKIEPRRNPPPRETSGHPSWTPAIRGDRRWLIGARRDGPTIASVDTEVGWPTSGQPTGIDLVVACDGRVAGQLSDGILRIAWINRLNGTLTLWSREHDPNAELAISGRGDGRLLAIGMHGRRAVECVFSNSTSTVALAFDQSGCIGNRNIRDFPSRSAIKFGNDILTVREDRVVLDESLRSILPSGCSSLESLDGACSAGRRLLVTVGASDSARIVNVVTSRPGNAGARAVLRVEAANAKAVRELDEFRPPSMVLTFDQGVLTAHQVPSVSVGGGSLGKIGF